MRNNQDKIVKAFESGVSDAINKKLCAANRYKDKDCKKAYKNGYIEGQKK